MEKLYKKSKYLFLQFALLVISSISYAQISNTMVYTPAASGDDAEEATSGTVGTMDLTSSDLELMKDGSRDQIIGIRFKNITIPQGELY